MALGIKTGGKDFQKGQPGGPGRKPLPAEVKTIRRATHAHIAEVGTMALEGNVSGLEEIVRNAQSPNSPYSVIQVAFATCLLKAIKKGDSFALNAILDRIVGKVKVDIEMTGAGGGPILMAHMTLDDVRREYAQLIDEELKARNKG